MRFKAFLGIKYSNISNKVIIFFDAMTQQIKQRAHDQELLSGVDSIPGASSLTTRD